MKTSAIICDGMIFQAGKPIRLFGSGGGTVSATMGENTVTETFLKEKWCIELPALDYGGPFEIYLSLDGREKVIKDVWIGDVYLLAGQSNMQFKLEESVFEKERYRDIESVRLFSTERLETGEFFYPEDGWVECKKETAGKWPCLGYMLGDILSKKTDHKIGFVTCYQGAATIQAYMPDEPFIRDPSLDIFWRDRFEIWFDWNVGHSKLYHYQLEGQIAPFAFKSVVWYQGESNCGEEESPLYGRMLQILIESWRNDLKDDKLPFVVVQIADFEERLGAPWTRIQEAQTDIQYRMDKVKTVISKDICEKDDIHPKHKEELAKRIAGALEKFEASKD